MRQRRHVAAIVVLLDAAVVAMAVGIFEAQPHLWTIFLQVEELLAVERAATLPGPHAKGRENSQHSSSHIQKVLACKRSYLEDND